MSVERIGQVLNATTGLSPTEKLILIGIANHDGDGGAWPSRATLARYAECSDATVKRALRSLAAKGVIRVEQNAGGTATMRADRRPNLYHITLDGGSSVNGGSSGAPTGGHPRPDGGSSVTERGVIAVTPEPSLELSTEPSTEPSTPHDFDEFWELYPRRVAKADALKAWRQMPQHERALAIVAIPHHIALWRAEGRGTRVVPYPATWLRRESWNDELGFIPDRAPGGGSVMDRIRRATGSVDTASSEVVG